MASEAGADQHPGMTGPGAAAGNASIGLAELLKAETRQLHARVERAGIMGALLRGAIDRRAYCLLLFQLHAIYAALEAAMDRHAGHPAIEPVCVPELRRRDALADDLVALHGPSWAHELELQPAARAYVQRLARLADEAPALLIAHAYVRYLGDLNGGRVLHNRVRETLHLDDGAGMRFYQFESCDTPTLLARRLRAALDATELDDLQRTALADEARLGFRMHERLFEELAAAVAP
jgi:heme oxygenase